MWRRRRWAATVAVVVVIGAVGCSEPSTIETYLTYYVQRQGQPLSTEPSESIVATIDVPSIDIFARRGDEIPALTLTNPNEDGAPRVLLALSYAGEWIEVLLPIRPNGTKGWVRESDVKLVHHFFRIKVELSERRLTLWERDSKVLEEKVGIGTARTPTPVGVFYTTSLLRPPTRGGPYGEYAFGLSGYSETLASFLGGEPRLGIHGTPKESDLGRQVSHGCVRMSNDAITRLADVVPLGTPVFVTP